MKLASEVSAPMADVLEKAQEAAAATGIEVFLVGGPVRDLLLKRDFTDLDLLVETEAGQFVDRLAGLMSGTVRSFPRFMTYKVESDAGVIDISSARSEVYESSGELPQVRPATLLADLPRRDFTMNAMAMRLRDGELYDPCGGEADLEKKLIRTLHRDSFIDDPTRMFRAVRFAARLGFSIEETALLDLRQSLGSDALRSVSRTRIWREIFLAFSEPNLSEVMAQFEAHGLLRSFLPNMSRELVIESFGVADRIAKDLQIDRKVVLVAGLFADRAPDTFNLSGSELHERQITTLHRALRERASLSSMNEVTEDELWRKLSGFSDEGLSISLPNFPEFREICLAVLQARRLALPFSTAELELSPGPHIGQALRDTREQLQRGLIDSNQALDFARGRARAYLDTD